uniref:coiled-coil domain-containing protein 157-like n=1 Tax=Myxine glutinosa TaxID=7769 RepID=UPI00358E759A
MAQKFPDDAESSEESTDLWPTAESLRQDLSELQACLIEVSSRCGSSTFPSWRYPHLRACELDLAALLEPFADSENEEEEEKEDMEKERDGRVLHIMLLELLIDRLVLLLQMCSLCMDTFMRRPSTPTRAPSLQISVGMASLKFWHILQELWTQQMSVTQPQLVQTDILHQEANDTTVDHITPIDTDSSKHAAAVLPIKSGDENNSPSHIVVEVCEMCSMLQKNLQVFSNSLITTCKSCNLPSSDASFLMTMEQNKSFTENLVGTTILPSLKELSQLATAEVKDLYQIIQQAEQLETQVAKAREQRKKEQCELDTSRQEVVDNQKLLLENEKLRLEEKVEQLEAEKEKVKKDIEKLEEKTANLQDKLKVQMVITKELEETNEHQTQQLQLASGVNAALETARDEARRLARGMGSMRAQYATLEAESQNQRLVAEEEMKIKVFEVERLRNRNEELSKQVTMAEQRTVVLAAETERLHRDLAEVRQKAQDQETQHHQTQQEMLNLQEQLQEQIQAAEQERHMLEDAAVEAEKAQQELQTALAESLEQQHLLVAFPELHRPSGSQAESTGDVVLDMERQLQANGLRMRWMQAECQQLQESLSVLRQHQQDGTLKVDSDTHQAQWWLPTPSYQVPGVRRAVKEVAE